MHSVHSAFLRNMGGLIMNLSCLHLYLCTSRSLASHIQFILKPCQSYLQDRSRICQLRFRLIVCVVPSSVRFCVPTSLLSGRSGWWLFSDCHFAIRSGMRLTGSGRARAFGYKVRPSSTFFCYSSRGSRLLP